MSDKKHIDRLFQEQLKDLDKAPDPKVWNAIEQKLKEKKKTKRIIPIWWYGTGAAALLILSLALIRFINQENTLTPFSPNIIIADTPESDTSNTNRPTKHLIDSIKTKSAFKNKAKISNITTTKPNIKKTKKILEHSKNNALQPTYTFSKQQSSPTDNTVATKESNNIDNKNNTALTHTPTEQKQATPDKTTTEEQPPNTLSIEEAIASTEPTPKEKKQTKKWDIQPNVAPVYYNSFGSGSHLDDQFINNSKTGEINTSYGVNVGYAVNERLKIRSGVNNLSLSFNTNDIVSSSNTLASHTSNIANLAVSNQGENLAFFSNNNSSSFLDTPFVTSTSSSSSSSEINQSISYFEVPLELEYHLVNTRIRISLIGGFSTFILDNNRVYSESNNNRVYIGEATNINTISFSTNFGIGLDYNLTKRLNINLEPTFKYQLNAFSNTSGSFRPYIIGVYTGFNYQF
ncbi:porin family protein [Formosa sediminum]|uniref:Porin family protein n=1 Tax=Formosa sediminum TaxID=2594004 RepID=A0A516GNL3_9FLAO|nr:porin family protein [Formosa sediminum]QDO93107.1 porin family protein [Formosa sediminum]